MTKTLIIFTEKLLLKKSLLKQDVLINSKLCAVYVFFSDHSSISLIYFSSIYKSVMAKYAIKQYFLF